MNRSYAVRIPVLLLVVIAAAVSGNSIGCIIIGLVHDTVTYKIKLNDLAINLLFVVVFTITTFVIEEFVRRKNELIADLHNIKEKNKTDYENQSVSIKDEKGYHTIKFGDLVYLSSHGKKSAYHTTEKVYTVNQLLKDVVEALPSELFLRVHKQFIININYLKQIRYFEGGRYTAYLSDEDETIIPVGRNMGSLIKEKFGI